MVRNAHLQEACLYIQVEDEDQRKNSHSLIVIRASYRARDVGGHNCNESSRRESSALALDLFDEKVGRKRAER